MPHKVILTNKEYEALILLVEEEQLIMIDDEENEFWNTIRRKLKHFSNKKWQLSPSIKTSIMH